MLFGKIKMQDCVEARMHADGPRTSPGSTTTSKQPEYGMIEHLDDVETVGVAFPKQAKRNELGLGAGPQGALAERASCDASLQARPPRRRDEGRRRRETQNILFPSVMKRAQDEGAKINKDKRHQI